MSEIKSKEEEECSQDIKSGNSDWNWSWSNRRSILPGLVIITLGLIFLARNLTGFELDNWWALFILIPAVNNFSSALNGYRKMEILGVASADICSGHSFSRCFQPPSCSTWILATSGRLSSSWQELACWLARFKLIPMHIKSPTKSGAF